MVYGKQRLVLQLSCPLYGFILTPCKSDPYLPQHPDGLALNGNAPRIFMKVTRHGLPWVSVATCASFGLLAYMGVTSGSGKVFGWLANM